MKKEIQTKLTPNQSTIAYARVGKPKFRCKQWMTNKWNLNATWNAKENQVQETLLDLLQWLKFQRKNEGSKDLGKEYFHPLLVMALKPFLYGGLCTLLWLTFGRVSHCFITNLLKYSEQKIIEYVQNHFGEVRMLVKNIYKISTKNVK